MLTTWYQDGIQARDEPWCEKSKKLTGCSSISWWALYVKIRKPNNSTGLSTLRDHLGRNRGAMKREVFGKNNLMICATLRRRKRSGNVNQLVTVFYVTHSVSAFSLSKMSTSQKVVPYGSLPQRQRELAQTQCVLGSNPRRTTSQR